MKNSLISLTQKIDGGLGRVHARLRGERPALLTFLFHGIFRDRAEIERNLVDPQQEFTLEDFRQFVDYFLTTGYRFVSPDDILGGLDPDQRYVMATFDDGYFNNTRTLPILTEYAVPALFFISTNHVKEGKCFWWDVLYRERLKRGVPSDRTREERHDLAARKHGEIESLLIQEFGADALKPVGDADRPMTPSELCDFSRSEHVALGNHTRDHVYLPNCDAEELRAQIGGAQQDLLDMTGRSALAISYPSGFWSDESIRISREAGIRMGVTVQFRKNYFPVDLDSRAAMELGRFIPTSN
ncbi:MAG: polysaccharide deacetylase family protein, partial [Candidatus Eisenbacteria bacterium]|nr:polysaccharide deacetylase family protein [Candidatus Eisenbacteria bacterium]